MMRVLLTGASGFIGRHCLPLLVNAGFEVHATASRSARETASRSGVYWHKVDLLEGQQVDGLLAEIAPTHLLHFAWYAVHGRFWAAQENLRWVQASLGLLEAFARAGGQRVVMAGSCAEYDWNYGYCSELTTPLRPGSLYGACKHALQAMLGAFSRQTGLSSAWGRIFFLYGPHEGPGRLVSSVICSLLRGQPVRCSQGNQVRDFLYVEDVVSAFAALLRSDVQGPINIASGFPVRIREVVEAIGRKIGNQELIRFGELPTPPEEPPLLVADVRRMTEEMSWMPSLSLDAGLDHTIDWWKRELPLGAGRLRAECRG